MIGSAIAITDESRVTIGREFSPILERNTVIPASRVESYFPVHDHQTVVRLVIYQGESRSLENNICIGELEVPLPLGEGRDKQIRVRFTFDVNGLLEVETTVATGAQKKLVIEGAPGSMTPEEIEQRLKALEAIKIHPRETMENRTLLARGERLYEESLGAVRQHVSRELARFESVLAGQNPRDVAKAREELVGELDRIESRVW